MGHCSASVGRSRYALNVDLSHLLLEVLGGVFVGLSLGLIGAGGAILSVPIFALVLGHSTQVAILEALAVTGSIAAFAAVRAGLARRIEYTWASAFVLPGIVGAWVGGPIGAMLSDDVQAGLFSSLAVVAAWRMVATAPKDSAEGTGSERSRGRTITLAVAVGFVIGILTAVIGVGGGFLLIPALVLVARVPMHLAVGTSLLIIALNSVVAFTSNARHSSASFDAVAWTAVAIVVACGILGSVAGSALAAKIPARALRRIFAVMLVLVAISVLLHALGLLGVQA